MQQYLSSRRRCDECEAPAVVRFTVSRRSRSPRASFRDQAYYRCPVHAPTFDQAYLWGLGATETVIVIDPAFTRQVLGVQVPMDDQTRPFPPIGTTVRRRPPVPPAAQIQELTGADLLRALADELERPEPDSVTRDETAPVLRLGQPLTDDEADLYGPDRPTGRES
jgi:hypothetical protein